MPAAPRRTAGLAVPPLALLCSELLETTLVLFCFAEPPADGGKGAGVRDCSWWAGIVTR